jgi:sRNA-binding regulator protein Hfq
MKDTVESIAVDRSVDEAFANRKLIRPSLNRTDHNHHNNDHNHNHNHGAVMGERRERGERADRGDRGERNDRNGGRKAPPPEHTNAENFYYQKQMQSRTAMVIVLCDGEEVHGIIEWYDKTCIKINRNDEPNLMIYKPSIKYIFKEGENLGK